MTVEDAPGIDWKGRCIVAGGILIASGLAAAAFWFGMRWLVRHHASLWQVMGVTVLYAAAIMGIVWLGRRRLLRFTDLRQSPAMKLYGRRIMAVAVVYTLAVLAAVFAFIGLHPPGPLAYLVALIPAVAGAGFFVVVGLYLREETDEFWRNVQVESGLLAMGGAVILTMGWGFLELFRLVPHFPSLFIAPLCALLYGPSVMIVHRRYR